MQCTAALNQLVELVVGACWDCKFEMLLSSLRGLYTSVYGGTYIIAATSMDTGSIIFLLAGLKDRPARYPHGLSGYRTVFGVL